MSAAAPGLGVSRPRTDASARAGLVSRAFAGLCAVSAWLGLGVLIVLLGGVLWQGAGWLSWSFLTHYDSRHPAEAGILAGLWGTAWLVSLATLFAVPVGVGAGIFLEEYEKKGWLRTLIEINLSNLAGVPSIVYGILGMAVFVKMFGAFQGRPKVLEIGFASARRYPAAVRPHGFIRWTDAGAVDFADGDCGHSRGAARRAFVAAAGILRARRDALADHSSPAVAGRDARHYHGRDSRGLPRDRRNRAAVDGRSRGFPGQHAGGHRVPGRRGETPGRTGRSALRFVHGAARFDLQLDFAAGEGIPSCGGGCHSGLARSAPGLQYRGQRDPRRMQRKTRW